MEHNAVAENKGSEVCPLCGDDKANVFHETKDYFLTKEEFSVLECPTCRHLYTYPWPERHNLSKYYQSENYLSHKEKPESMFEILYDRVRWFNLRVKFSQSAKGLQKGKLLDYGCGRGDFAGLASKRGWECYGLEQDDEARTFAKQRHKITVFAPGETDGIQAGSFRLITMFHVLEHLPDVDTTFKNIHNWLEPTGRLIIALPNPDSYDACHYEKYWAAWDVPRHLHHFRSEVIIRVAEKHGLIFEKTYPMYWDAFFVAALSEQYKGSRNKWIRAASLGLKSNIRALFSGQFSSLIYQFRKSL
ncbi:MAG: class I SAM-dependent methyltransferase [Bacteroidetes bacterium]|nr:class I SAM-dependent methyltransferase [Bacteroidota bacterium]